MCSKFEICLKKIVNEHTFFIIKLKVDPLTFKIKTLLKYNL